MNIHIFNACLLIGWLLVLVGGVLVSPGIGLACAGLLLLVLAFISARLGGLYSPDAKMPKSGEAA